MAKAPQSRRYRLDGRGDLRPAPERNNLWVARARHRHGTVRSQGHLGDGAGPGATGTCRPVRTAGAPGMEASAVLLLLARPGVAAWRHTGLLLQDRRYAETSTRHRRS